MPELVEPTPALRASYVEALEEFHGEGRYLNLDAKLLARPEGFADYVANRLAARGVPPRGTSSPYRVPETVLWWVEAGAFVGHVSIRHELTPWLLEQGGHIGYDVRPSQRRRGHATAMLAAALPVTKALGIDPALITCLAENVASRKIIEHAGAVFEDVRAGRRRYWIATAPVPDRRR